MIRPGLILLLALGCSMRPQHGGSARHGQSVIVQAENPKAPSTQETTAETSITRTLPAGSAIEQIIGQGSNAVRLAYTLSQAMPEYVRTVDTSKTSLGAVQQDTARELGTRLAAMAPIRWVGVALILGAGALGYFTGRWKAPCILAGVGVGLIVLASILPGHELLFLALGLALAVAVALFENHLHHWFSLPNLKPP